LALLSILENSKSMLRVVPGSIPGETPIFCCVVVLVFLDMRVMRADVRKLVDERTNVVWFRGTD